MFKRNCILKFLIILIAFNTIYIAPTICYAKKKDSIGKKNVGKTNSLSKILKDFSVQYNFENYFSLGASDLRKNDFNVGNRLTRSTKQSLDADLRGDFKFQINKNIKAKIRPRLQITNKKIELQNPGEDLNPTVSKLDITDAYVEELVTQKFSYTLGLQVYQWGPAEFSNSSNPFFHFNFSNKSFFYKEKGKALTRFNYQINDNLSTSFIAEPISNNEALWREHQDFNPQFMLKTDWVLTSQNYVGFVLGKNEETNNYFGEYLNFYLSESSSMYFDFRHEQGSAAYHPKKSQWGYTELTQDKDNHDFKSIGTVGLRFEASNWDYRLEYFYNQPGYNKDEYSTALASTHQLSPAIINNIKRFAKPGLELYGQQYLYASVRATDFLNIKELSGYLKYIHSAQDSSAAIITDLEKNISDSWTGYIEYTQYLGDDTSELSLQQYWQAFAGAKWNI